MNTKTIWNKLLLVALMAMTAMVFAVPAFAADSSAAQKKGGADSPADGTYQVENFTFTGGTGKAKATCESVIVESGMIYAVFEVSSDKMTHIYMGEAPSNDETTSLYDPTTDTCGANVYPISNQTVIVPVVLNQETDCAIRTTAMSAPHWIKYKYTITLTITPAPTPEGGGSSSTGTTTDTGAENMTKAQEAINAAKSDLTDKAKIEAALAAIALLTEEQKTTIAGDIETLNKAKTEIEAKEAEEAKEAAEKAEIEKVQAGKIAVKKVKGGKKSITVTWKKNSDLDGYQVSYKKGTKTKTVTVKGGTTTKKTVKKLQKGKKYTVKVRGYKLIGDQVVFTKWSAAKTVKVK